MGIPNPIDEAYEALVDALEEASPLLDMLEIYDDLNLLKGDSVVPAEVLEMLQHLQGVVEGEEEEEAAEDPEVAAQLAIRSIIPQAENVVALAQ